MYKTSLFIVALALATFASPLTKEEQQLTEQLENADFVDYDLQFEDYDSDEDAGRSLKESVEKLKNKCTCSEPKSCGCCLATRVFGFKIKGCLNATVIPEDKAFQIALGVAGRTVINETISAKRLERICDRLPGKLDKVKMCLYTTLTDTEEEGLVSCTSLDAIVFDKTVATLKFNCLQYKDNKLGFGLNQDTDRDSIMKIKIKNPIKGIMNLFKKNKA